MQKITQNISPIKSRILQFAGTLNISKRGFYEKIGVSRGTLESKTGITEDVMAKFMAAYKEVSPEWLLTGHGSMLKEKSIQLADTETLNESGPEINSTVPLLPVSARGGSLDDFVTSVRPEDCEKIISPISGVDFAIPVVGDSMAPEYPNGSTVLIKKINERAFIVRGQVYVLDTCNGSVIKKIMPGPDDESVTCVSLNSEYPQFVVRFEDMFGMYRVMMLLALK